MSEEKPIYNTQAKPPEISVLERLFVEHMKQRRRALMTEIKDLERLIAQLEKLCYNE